jgi:hypothetical protein
MTRRSAVVTILNRVIVSIYKIFGFVVLTGILVWLGSYVFMNVFYLFNRTWVAPTVISPSDEEVRDLSSDLAHTLAQRDKLVADRRELLAKRDDADRTLEAERAFQEMYKEAIKADLGDRKEAYAELGSLVEEYRKAKDDIIRSNRADAAISEERSRELHDARLKDDDGLISASHQRAEMTNANVSLMQKTVELETQLRRLRRQVKGLSSADSGGPGGVVSTEILTTRRQYDQSVVEAKRAEGQQAALADSIAAMDQSIARYDALAEAVRQSPFLVAGEKDFEIAFVPYDNLDRTPPDVPIYRCAVGPLWCDAVGHTGELLGGEVVRRHAFHNKELRGRFIRIHLEDPAAAQRGVLYVGRSPLFL